MRSTCQRIAPTGIESRAFSESARRTTRVLWYEMTNSENVAQDCIPEPIYDWNDEPTVEIPAQTMHDVVYGEVGMEDTAPVRVTEEEVPGHAAVGPSRPTRDMRPLGRRGTLGRGRKHK